MIVDSHRLEHGRAAPPAREPRRPADRVLLVLLVLTLLLTVLADLTVAIAEGLALRLQRREAPVDRAPPDR